MIPTAELPHWGTIELRDGTTGGGAPAYGTPRRLRCKVDGRRRQVRRTDGTVVIAAATATLRPTSVTSGSRFTHVDTGDVYEVLEVTSPMELRRIEKTELILDGPRPAS